MKDETLSTLKKENNRLKAKVRQLQTVLSHQKVTIDEYETNWSLKLFSDLEVLLQQYTLFTDPPPVKIKASYKNEAAFYEVKPAKIIGVFSKGRTKQILLDTAIPGIGGSGTQTNILYSDTNFEKLQKLINQSDFLFCLVKRGVLINLKHYNLESNFLITNNTVTTPIIEYNNIKISKKSVTEFIEKKKAFDNISSLQKNQLRDILAAINKSITNFEK
jgi:hypothetical protein